MPIYDLYSKRQKKLRGEVSDTYNYDDLPKPLRVQIVQIWQETLGELHIERDAWGDIHYNSIIQKTYGFIVHVLCREYGVFRLSEVNHRHGIRNTYTELKTFFLEERNTERALDAVEVSFRAIDLFTRKWDYLHRQDAAKKADGAIEELNARFKQHGVGYQFTSGKIVRIDSELIYSEAVKPALKLLQGQHYAGAQQEYLKAHEHYRTGNAKEALNECLKAFESVMKAICDKRGWAYNQNATATSLIKVCFDNKLIPKFWDAHYSSLRSLLESGVPTGRNKSGGHGQGTNPVAVPNHIVAYMLHMTASAIVFLAEAEKELP